MRTDEVVLSGMASSPAIVLTSASVLKPSKDIVWRSVAGEVVLLDSADNVLLGLNGTGGKMWSLLDGKSKLGDIADRLAAEYKQERSSVLADLVEFAEVLVARGLLGAA